MMKQIDIINQNDSINRLPIQNALPQQTKAMSKGDLDTT